MNEAIIVIAFVLWYTFSLVISETTGVKRKMGREWAFFFCMIFSPVIGFPIVYFGKRK